MTLVTRSGPFLGGRDHTSHRIVRAGLPVPAAVALIYTIGICLGMVAFVVSRIDRTSAYVLTAAVLILSVLSGVLLSLVPADDDGGEPTG